MKSVRNSLHVSKDRISDLPEPIRNKVISFLSMEEAIRTSVLSREWRYVTASLPNIELDQNMFEEKGYDENQFRNIVDRLLISRARVDVERFELSVKGDGNLEPLLINAWILFAIHNNVHDFRLTVWGDEISEFKLPCCFFQQFSTLTDLCLVGLGLCLTTPPGAVFPRLKRCRFSYVTFDDDSLMKNLFSSCPSIVELTLHICDISDYNKRFTISSPSLKILTLSLFTYSDATEIQINASNLQKIDYTCIKQPIMSSETLCSLLTASFASRYKELWILRGWAENSILYGLCNIVRLSLCAFYIEQNSLGRLSSCSSLRHLELEIYTKWRHVNVVLTLLKVYNKLVTLCISFEVDSTYRDIPNDQQISSDKFMLKHLNTVELVDFQGSKEEIHIVRYLLENAAVLEKMTIKYLGAQRNNATTRMKVSEELVNVIKASAHATILFK